MCERFVKVCGLLSWEIHLGSTKQVSMDVVVWKEVGEEGGKESLNGIGINDLTSLPTA